MAFGRPTDSPIGGPVKLIYSITNQNTLSRGKDVDNSKAVEIGEVESPRRGLTGPPGKPAIPTADLLYQEKIKQSKLGNDRG